MNRTSSS